MGSQQVASTFLGFLQRLALNFVEVLQMLHIAFMSALALPFCIDLNV